MSSAVPGPIYGLEVPPGEILITSQLEFPAAFRITMAALDPTQEPTADEEGNVPTVCRSTLRLVKRNMSANQGEDEEVDDEYLKALLGGSDDEDEDDEANGGPSDPAKAKKQKQAAAIQKLLAAATEEEEDEEMEDAGAKPKSKKDKSKAQPKGKGKGKAVVEEEEEDEEKDDLSEDGDLEDFVLCTLDTEKHYQQPLDITINQGEKVFFVVSGTHTVYLTGNYIMDDREPCEEEEEGDEEEDEDYDLEDLDFVVGDEGSDEESDELDDIDNPRITEVESDSDEIPTLVATSKKGKLKRTMDEQEASLDDIIAKANASTKDTKASKKQEKQQQKKLKNNKGEAVAAEVKQEAQEDAKKDGKKDSKKDKKDAKKTVQFAKNLEQGPTGSAEKAKQAAAKPSITKVQGITVDDRTVGKGRTAKNGDTVGVRYIGKLQNGKQFDANKKGKPFAFKVGKGQVIKGWDIGIAGMAIGGERRLTIPPHLAYASKSLPGIPANSTLIFDIKLLEIK